MLQMFLWSFLYFLFLLGSIFSIFFIKRVPKKSVKPLQLKADTVDLSNKANKAKEKKKDYFKSLELSDLFDGKSPENFSFSLVATGDYIPARSVNYKSLIYKDFTWTVKDFAKILNSYDIALINLEAPLIKNCPVTNYGFKFCGDYRHLKGLSLAGIDIACMANNHSVNYGISGLEETRNYLKSNNIRVCGTSKSPISYITVQGRKIAFVAFNDIGEFGGVLSSKEELIKEYITKAKENADIIITSFHWGTEYTYKPNKRQIELAHLAVDLGSNLVLGNHPHWIQPAEIYKNSLIVYAHGNFVFDQMWSEETKQGLVGIYFFNSSGQVIDASFLPVYIKNYGKATLGSNSILKQFEKITYKFNQL